MKPLIIQVLKDSIKETVIVNREEFYKVLKEAYEQGVEDGKNAALANAYKEQWMPYKYIGYPMSVPTGTGTGGDPEWCNISYTDKTVENKCGKDEA